MQTTTFPIDDLTAVAVDLRITPAEAVYLSAAMRLVAKVGKLTAAQAIHAVRTNRRLADYLRDRLQACVASALSEGVAR
tara:strand:+ start:427 stop:663 length:237 start_codon:yes stop_codon:yes gene_type:complete